MKTKFYILLSQKSCTGYAAYGEYWLGSDRDEAMRIFSLLKGSQEISNEALLHLDFIETADEIPLKIRILCCTIEEYTCNCKILAKETFKRMNFQGQKPDL